MTGERHPNYAGHAPSGLSCLVVLTEGAPKKTAKVSTSGVGGIRITW